MTLFTLIAAIGIVSYTGVTLVALAASEFRNPHAAFGLQFAARRVAATNSSSAAVVVAEAVRQAAGETEPGCGTLTTDEDYVRESILTLSPTVHALKPTGESR